MPPLPGATDTDEEDAPLVEVLPEPVTVEEADSKDDAADAVSSAVVSVGVVVTVPLPEATAVEMMLFSAPTEDVADVDVPAAEEELEPPVMWKGKEYWKVVGSESSEILKP